jgi:hypothetical protein
MVAVLFLLGRNLILVNETARRQRPYKGSMCGSELKVDSHGG